MQRQGRFEGERLEELAREALARGTEEQALTHVARGAAGSNSARLWQWTALLQRAIDEHADALRSFEKAAALDPADAGIAHGHARAALEAGIDAVALFERARALAPTDGAVILGHAAARFAARRGEEAAADLSHILVQAPLWQEGHRQLAQLQSMLGRPELASRSLDRALETAPTNPHLWRMLWDLNVQSSDFRALLENIDRGEAAGADLPSEAFRGIALSELGETDQADRCFAAAGALAESIRIWHVRHLIRSGRAQQALPLVDAGLASADNRNFWPYASIVWRLTQDPRSGWLHDESRFVSTGDLPLSPDQLSALASRLRSLHVAKGQYLDQSVRGGTQTDGPLFSRIDPEIRTLRAAIVNAVRDYIAALPAPDPRHPLLGPPRDRPIRFSGSWSVRLRDSGRHANHVHPQGWISSAFYVALPRLGLDEPEESGWLTLGQPPEELKSGLDPELRIEPKLGRLVLFPSWMWHGTRPFRSGERLTVAFDIRLPN